MHLYGQMSWKNEHVLSELTYTQTSLVSCEVMVIRVLSFGSFSFRMQLRLEVKPSTQSLLLRLWWFEKSTKFSSKNIIAVLDQLHLFETGIKIHSNLYLMIHLPFFWTIYFSHSVHHLPSPSVKKKRSTPGRLLDSSSTFRPKKETMESCRVSVSRSRRIQALGAVGIGQLFPVGMRI